MTSTKMVDHANCSICNVEISNSDVYGPVTIPTCWDCYGAFGKDTEVLAKKTRGGTPERDAGLSVIRANRLKSPKVIEAEKKIKIYEAELEELHEQVGHLEDEIYRLELRIMNARGTVKKAKGNYLPQMTEYEVQWRTM